MVYLSSAQSFLEQSQLLLQARPTTTRVTTRYTLDKPPAPSESTASTAPPKPRGLLVLKTYDPVSGTCLKYRTHKAAEVGRLVAGMGRCARVMAAQDPAAEDGAEEGAEGEGDAMKVDASPAAAAKADGKTEGQAGGQAQGGGGAGGGKKKKKGKR